MKKVISCCFILICHSGFAQKQGQPMLDSLEAELEIAREDTSKMKLMEKISYGYCNFNPDKGIAYGKKLLKLATKTNNKKYLAFGYLFIGVNLASKSDFPNALENELKALEIFEKTGDIRNKGKVLHNIGNIYYDQNDNVKSLEYYLKALKIYEEYGMKKPAATTMGNLGLVFQFNGELDKSLEYHQKALAVFREMKDFSGMARTLANIGIVFDDKLEFVKALQYKYAGLEIWLKLGNTLSTAKVYKNIAYTYIQIAKHPKMKHLPDSLSDKNSCLQKAENFLNLSLDLNNKIGNIENASEIYLGLSNVYSEKGEFMKSLEYYKHSVHLSDSIYSSANQQVILAIEKQKANELRVKELQVKNLQMEAGERARLFLLSGILVLFLFSFIFYNSLVKQKQTTGLLKVEKKKSEDLLLNILPEDVADELKETGHSRARSFENVTVLFTDFVNFFHYSSSMSAEQLVEEIDYCFSAFDEICTRHGLEKIKTIGDVYMAVAGLSENNTNHAGNCVQASVDMINFMHGVMPGYDRKPVFQIRVGLHSGPIVAGIVGLKKYAYDIWGDTVNTAARIEQNSEEGRINVSGASYELIKDDYQFFYRGKIQAKNKGELDMYFVK